MQQSTLTRPANGGRSTPSTETDQIYTHSLGAPTSAYPVISAEQLHIQKNNAGYTVIDTRSPDAFNGWAMANEARGGAIPGAKLFSAQWLKRVQVDLDRAYKRLSLTLQSNIIIYGYDSSQMEAVANWLVDKKQHPPGRIQLLEKGYSEWIKSPHREVKVLSGYRSLVPVLKLQALVAENPAIKVVEIGWDEERNKLYRQGHIPGAIYWDSQEFEHPPIYELKSVETIRASLIKLGISCSTPVIVYSTESFAAARGATVMKYAGVKQVAMLNGGKDSWLAESLPLQAGWVKPEPLSCFGFSGPGDSHVVINMDQAKKLRLQKNGALVSIRTWDEFIGKTSGYDYFSKKGRIPGALWGRGESYTAWDLNDYQNPDKTMRSAEDIKAFWTEWGIFPETMELSFFCANGWGAAEVWWYAQAMGYTNNTVFSSGSMAWLSDSNNPVARGELSKDEMILEWQQVSGNLPTI